MTTALPSTQTEARRYGNFPLDSSGLVLRIPVTAAAGLQIVASVESGTWTGVTLSAKWTVQGMAVPQAFTSPRTIGIGGGVLTFTEDELVGVDEIVITYASGTLESAGARAMFYASAKRTVQYVDAGITPVRTTDPMSDAPDPGGEG